MAPTLWSLKPTKGQRLTSKQQQSSVLQVILTLVAISCCLVGGDLQASLPPPASYLHLSLSQSSV